MKRAVVRGPLVLNAGMTVFHVIDEFILEILEQHACALLFLKVNIAFAVDIVAWGECQKHVDIVGLFIHSHVLS